MSGTLEAALQYGAACKRLVDAKLENANEQITAALFDEIKRLRAESERLREYAGHKNNCVMESWLFSDADFNGEQMPCDCGYDELRKELEEST